MIDTLIVLAKRPVAGRVKTRLVPPLSHEQAAQVAAAALWDTLRAVERSAARRRLLAFDARPDGWLPAGWDSCRQPAGGLDERMAAAFAAAGRRPALLVGMDTPQLRRVDLEAFDSQRYDACLGMASDGGYWTIGLRDPRIAAAAILGVPMSSPQTGAHQLRRLHGLGLRVQLLDERSDVDSFDDACRVADDAPDTAFAHVLAPYRAALADRVS